MPTATADPVAADPLALFTNNRRLAFFVLRRLFRRLPRRQEADATQAALTGLWKAAQRFDPGRGIQFSTFAVRCIHHAVLNAIQPRRTPGPMKSLDTRDGAHDLPDRRSDDIAEHLDRIDRAQHLARLLRSLPPRSRLVVELRYGLGGEPTAADPRRSRRSHQPLQGASSATGDRGIAPVAPGGRRLAAVAVRPAPLAGLRKGRGDASDQAGRDGRSGRLRPVPQPAPPRPVPQSAGAGGGQGPRLL